MRLGFRKTEPRIMGHQAIEHHHFSAMETPMQNLLEFLTSNWVNLFYHRRMAATDTTEDLDWDTIRTEWLTHFNESRIKPIVCGDGLTSIIQASTTPDLSG